VSAEAVQAIRSALEKVGIEFTNGDEPGVKLKKDRRAAIKSKRGD
jgi:hypothetical protein